MYKQTKKIRIMKKIFRYTLAVLLGAMTMVACTNEYEYDAPSATDQGGNATISAAKTTYVFVPSDVQEYVVTVARIDSTQAQTISLTSDNSKFNVPASVSFAAGQRTQDVKITSDLPAGSKEKVNISLGESDAFLYGGNIVTLTSSVYRMFECVIAQQTMYGGQWAGVIYELGGGNYMIPGCFADGYDLQFSIDFKTNKVTIPAQYIDYYDDTYGRIAMTTGSATYDPENLLITETVKFTLPDSGFSFSGTHTVYIMFGSDPQE